MAKNGKDVLKAEEAVQELLDELSRLKSATELIDSAGDNSKTVIEASKNLIEKISMLIDKSEKTLTEISEAKLKSKLIEIQKTGTDHLNSLGEMRIIIEDLLNYSSQTRIIALASIALLVVLVILRFV